MVNMEYIEAVAMIWISQLGKPNKKIFDTLTEDYKGLEEIWNIKKETDLISDLGKKVTERLLSPVFKEEAFKIYENILRQKMSVTYIGREDYPFLLNNIYSRPTVLYYFGNLPGKIKCNDMISVVGSRRCTSYGKVNAFQFSRDLARSGVGIVSGMAAGVDAQAHLGAIEGEGYTIGVLAGGADVLYPPENKKIYEKIRTSGCIISEQIPGTPPFKSNFPARNRIIAGLSSGTLIIEAPKHSGAMITVDRAIEENRNIYAVPGDITSNMSSGCNELIKSGAKCVTSYRDILEDIGLVCNEGTETIKSIEKLSDIEIKIIKSVNDGMTTADQIVRSLGEGLDKILSGITMLEIGGFLQKREDGRLYLTFAPNMI